jgi:hypothetical protein
MPRSLQRLLCKILLALIACSSISGQSFSSGRPGSDTLYRYIQLKYGLNQEIYSGTQFYEKYTRYKGDPYYPADQFYPGTITLQGITYEELNLKFDCYTHQLVLTYVDLQDRYNQLILDPNRIDSFSLGPLHFQKYALSGKNPSFFQVMKTGPVTALILWKKNVRTISFDTRYTYEFTDPTAVWLMEIGGEVHPISGRKSFFSLFPDHLQPVVKDFLKTHRINFRKPDEPSISEMIRFTAQNLERTAIE